MRTAWAGPRNLADLSPTICERVIGILDNLPVGEPFNLVERVSIELTTQMLATLFDFPFEERYTSSRAGRTWPHRRKISQFAQPLSLYRVLSLSQMP